MVQILHIDSDYQINHFSVKDGTFLHRPIDLEKAVSLLKTVEFDLIISEPDQKALLIKSKENTI